MRTIVLAAGAPDYKNRADGQTSSQMMASVKGRPVIVWVVADLLKRTDDLITLVIRHDDEELSHFLAKFYGRNTRVTVKQFTSETKSILDSCALGLENADGPIRLVLGDTLLEGVAYGQSDNLYVSNVNDFSEKWCLVQPDSNGAIHHFFDKTTNLPVSDYKALVGRYEFSDAVSLLMCVEQAKNEDARELSAALALYAKAHPMKAIEVKNEAWIDFGHLEGLAKASMHLMESRAFNRIRIDPLLPILTKSSSNRGKLEQEAFWYENLPDLMKGLAPHVFSFEDKPDGAVLQMEYYGYPTLSEKFVYADLAPGFWQAVLNRLMGLVEHMRLTHPTEAIPNTCIDMYANKTFARLEALSGQSAFWVNIAQHGTLRINGRDAKSPWELKGFITSYAEKFAKSWQPGLIHGDLCFNNILYDAGTGIVKLIDPRGEFGAGVSMFGDPRYDMAKLRHSYCGKYDMIVEGMFQMTHSPDGKEADITIGTNNEQNESMFDDLATKHGYDTADIRMIEALLFLSMVPLHNDSLSKQKAMFYTGVEKLNRCYKESLT